MDVAHSFALVVKIVVFTTVLALGLNTTVADLAYLRRHPGLLLRSLLTMVIIAPIVAIVLALLLPIGPAASLAIIAGALAPGMPTVPRTEKTIGGSVPFACSLMVVTAGLGVVTIPIWLEVLRYAFGVDVGISAWTIVRTLVVGLLVPLLLGVAIRHIAPTVAEKIAAPTARFADALLPGLAVVILVFGASTLAQLGWAAPLAMVVASIVALVVGHALGGPDPRTRSVLAVANAMRFPALALLIASSGFAGANALPVVVAYLIVALLVTQPYLAWRKRVHASARGDEIAPSSATGSQARASAVTGTPAAGSPTPA